MAEITLVNGQKTIGKGGSSKWKGVSWNSRRSRWIANIAILGKRFSLGYFEVEDDAARAYNLKAKEIHKEFALFNDVSPMFPPNMLPYRAVRRDNRSGFYGVSYDTKNEKWLAQVQKNGKNLFRKSCKTAEEAAMLRDAAALEIFGDTAKLNFPEQQTQTT